MNKIEKASMTKEYMVLIKSTNFNIKCRKIINKENFNYMINSIKLKKEL